jgi:hypothetical protein
MTHLYTNFVFSFLIRFFNYFDVGSDVDDAVGDWLGGCVCDCACVGVVELFGKICTYGPWGLVGKKITLSPGVLAAICDAMCNCVGIVAA